MLHMLQGVVTPHCLCALFMCRIALNYLTAEDSQYAWALAVGRLREKLPAKERRTLVPLMDLVRKAVNPKAVSIELVILAIGCQQTGGSGCLPRTLVPLMESVHIVFTFNSRTAHLN